jgi:hypothetical protein
MLDIPDRCQPRSSRDGRPGAQGSDGDPISSAGKQQPHQVKEATTAHEAAQHGTDVRSQRLPGTDAPIPEDCFASARAAELTYRPSAIKLSESYEVSEIE